MNKLNSAQLTHMEITYMSTLGNQFELYRSAAAQK